MLNQGKNNDVKLSLMCVIYYHLLPKASYVLDRKDVNKVQGDWEYTFSYNKIVVYLTLGNWS